MTFTADYSKAIVIEAATYGYSSPNNPKAWCLHTPEEKPDDYPGTVYYFHNLTDREASTTYFVSYLGFVFQCVPEKEGAYGNVRDMGQRFDWETTQNLNLQTLSIEIEGYAASIATTMPRGSAQWKALIELMADRCKALRIPPERTFGHYQVSSARRDPGSLDMQAVITDVKAAMQGQEDDLTPEQAAQLQTLVDKVTRMEKDLANVNQWLFAPSWAKPTDGKNHADKIATLLGEG